MMFRAPFSFRAAELRALTDQTLMERIVNGDALAFEVLFDRHGGAAFSLAYRMCGRSTMAEDIVQETFLSLWRRGGRYDRTNGALDHIPNDQRRVIELAYFGGFTHSQIADMLELPAGTVKGRMRLGLVKLRLSLGDHTAAAATGGVG
jgi:RNA polymerase sigma-70 factor (ECF subfamily)